MEQTNTSLLLEITDISAYNTMGLNPVCEQVVLISDPDELIAHITKTPARLVGELSNSLLGDTVDEPLVLFRDGGVIGIESDADFHTITVQGSCSLETLVTHLIAHNIAGMELLSGIPGTVGAGLVQNVGAYGAQISTYFQSALAFHMESQTEKTLHAEEFQFQYRQSRFKRAAVEDTHLILEAVFKIPVQNTPSDLSYSDLQTHHTEHNRDANSLAEIRQTVLDVRSTKGMVVNCEGWTPCVGSYFISPAVEEPVARRIVKSVRSQGFANQMFNWYKPDASQIRVPAALVLRAAGFLNGDMWGKIGRQAGLSQRHILAVTAHTGATGSDVASLANYIQHTVKEKLGITLQQEIMHIGNFEIQPAETFLQSNTYTHGSQEPAWVKKLDT